MGFLLKKKNKLKVGDFICYCNNDYKIVEQYANKNILVLTKELKQYYYNLDNLKGHSGRRFKNLHILIKDKRELLGCEVW